jgi:hypothetical protein
MCLLLSSSPRRENHIYIKLLHDDISADMSKHSTLFTIKPADPFIVYCVYIQLHHVKQMDDGL